MDGIRNHKLALHRLASQGDKDALRELEANELTREAVDKVYDLRDKATKGDKAAMEELQRQAKGTSAAPALAPTSTGITNADVSYARSTATSAECQRWASVFASEHSKGREQGCANLLTSDKNFTAAAIIAELPTLPTDKERAAKSSRASSDALWEKAHAAVRSPQAQKILDAQSKAQGGATANAKAQQILAAQEKGGIMKPQSNRAKTDAIWDRAYNRGGR